MGPRPRLARLVLVRPDGVLLGTLPDLEISTPWWQDIKPVVDAVFEAHGQVITVLRILSVDQQTDRVVVAYLAEAMGTFPVIPCAVTLTADPHRAAYAEIGGPARDLAWARERLAALEIEGPIAATQVRTWNLSSLWCLTAGDQTWWLKAVPGFMAHEGAVIAALSAHPVPRLLAHDKGRVLLANIDGDDLYEAMEDQRRAMIAALVNIQIAWANEQVSHPTSVPGWRAEHLTPMIAGTLDRYGARLSLADRDILSQFVEDLPRRLADLSACGLPETLIHGDFHSGNVRGEGLNLTLLDWGDSGIGHPLLDQSAFLTGLDKPVAARLGKYWSELWRAAIPGSDPDRAAILIAPVSAARRAVVYQDFLDQIEPSEHPYHADDPTEWLGRTAQILRDQGFGN